MFKVTILAQSGIPVYQYPDSTSLPEFKELMLPALLTAIESYAAEIGKSLETIKFFDHKLMITKFNNDRQAFKLILAEDPDMADLIMWLKSEIISRRYNILKRELFSERIISDKFHDIVELIFKQNGSRLFFDLIDENSIPKLLSLCLNESGKNSDLETFLNDLTNEVPSKLIPPHPSIHKVGTHNFVIPSSFDDVEREKYMNVLQSEISPILGNTLYIALLRNYIRSN